MSSFVPYAQRRERAQHVDGERIRCSLSCAYPQPDDDEVNWFRYMINTLAGTDRMTGGVHDHPAEDRR